MGVSVFGLSHSSYGLWFLVVVYMQCVSSALEGALCTLSKRLELPHTISASRWEVEVLTLVLVL